MKCVIGALQWKLPRVSVPFNPAQGPRTEIGPLLVQYLKIEKNALLKNYFK